MLSKPASFLPQVPFSQLCLWDLSPQSLMEVLTNRTDPWPTEVKKERDLEDPQ